MSPEFLLTAFIVCVSPGIGVVYTLSMTLGGGLRAGMLAAVGCTIVTALHLAVAMAGLAAVLHASAVLFQTVKFAGVAFLLWMAWATLKGHGGMDIRAAEPGSAARIVWRGILLNLLNPKLPLFFVAFLPQFVPADGGARLLVELGFGFTAMTFVTFAAYALAAGFARQAILGNARVMTWLRRAFAASFAALGARLAMERA
ncbi:LysE family translocator [Frigidibacter sp.]|uniref:LysE family translocator n=1 Tax=Frigidibacter sp. TaxID=2586418 RepID=UPI0027358E6F|nr:LysE family translocator [Frigidibacter sp.]MDP3341669.1 LysE family translocator [Frigidibacter sp.]